MEKTIHQKLTSAMQDGFDLALNRLIEDEDESRQIIAVAAGTIDGEKFEVHILVTMNTPDFIRGASRQLDNAVLIGEVKNARHV